MHGKLTLRNHFIFPRQDKREEMAHEERKLKNFLSFFNEKLRRGESLFDY
jgi:hypothetical protein